MALYLGNTYIGSCNINERVEEKEINFYDYDGTLLYSYTKQEALALTALPQLPDRTSENLTNEGWNWTLAEIKEQLTDVGGIVNVGCTYYTTDGKTHIFVDIDEESLDKMQLRFKMDTSETGSVIINWGDGNTTTTTSTSYANYTHTYQNIGIYDISISGNFFIGDGVYITGDYELNKFLNIYKVNLGANFKGYMLYWLKHTKIQIISISSLNNVNSLQFYNCRFLKHITLGKTGVSSYNTGTFGSDISAEMMTISLPPTLPSIKSQMFYNRRIKSITIPANTNILTDASYTFTGSGLKTINLNQCTVLPTSFFSNHSTLTAVNLKEGLTTISNNAFYYTALEIITLPSTITTIGSGAFSRSYYLKAVFCKPTTPPTIQSDTFPFGGASGINTYVKFYVPRASYNAYITASNWADIASYIQPYDY